MQNYNIVLSLAVVCALVGCQPKSRGGNDLKDPVINPKGDRASEDAEIPNWFTKDPELDKAEGVSSDRAYTELKIKVGVQPVLVAVIDGGIDIEHEDLQGRLWTNPGETGLDTNGKSKETNGIDDDGNGFIDDVHGWNFLGSADGRNVDATTLELTRELVRMEELKRVRGGQLTSDEQTYLDQLSKDYDSVVDEAVKEFDRLTKARTELEAQYQVLKDTFNKPLESLVKADVENLRVTEPALVTAREEMLKVLETNGINSISRLDRVIERHHDELSYYYNKSFDPRKDIIGDDPYDFNDMNYGNNDVKGPDASHGTHVAGIIAAVRNNGLGIDGVAEDVRIMSVRAIPNGDEYDKDVANAVKYAVRNGARIINMSFGKSYSSPYKSEVDKAFLEASAKGVLIIHSAGNDNKNNDLFPSFPNRFLKNTIGGVVDTWMDIGASSVKKGETLPGDFSNFGVNTVDIFSPGVAIKSTVPDKDKYATYSGTSMASPVITGVAALALSQDPSISGRTLKRILMKNARQYPGLQVLLPQDPDATIQHVLFGSLSITGGIVDAMATLKEVLGL